ncbi:MAG: hypothetical protein IPL32_14635 [Chloracidobacterium sp.]|nr:hypothetical protein [Chloracidobacterium sp.]
MQIVEEQIVNKIRTLSDKEREDVLRYVNGVISKQDRPKKLGEKIQELVADVPDEVWEKLPTDGAEQHDHYIYGTPKR